MGMQEKYSYISEIAAYITDPSKLEKLPNLPEDILSILAHNISYFDGEGEKISKHKLARDVRVICYNNLADYGSTQHQKWLETEGIFKNNPYYIPYAQLIKDNKVLAMAKTERPNSIRKLGDKFGVNIIGAIPKKQNRVEVLASHYQYKWFSSFSSRFTKELDTFDNLPIPPVITVGELKKYDPKKPLRASMLTSLSVLRHPERDMTETPEDIKNLDFFITLPILEESTNFFEVSLRK